MRVKKERVRITRADKQEATRLGLLAAAAKTVGTDGYPGASVTKVTALANVANGTFYNYFESQQDMFNQLLPSLGEELLEFIRATVAGGVDSLEREELGFRAFFAYLSKNPAFYRILNEAETFAPKAFRDHMSNMANGYLRALRKAQEKGELQGFEPQELEVLVYILLSARNYLSYRFCYRHGKAGRLPDWIVRAYMKFITGGFVFGGLERHPKTSRKRPRAPANQFTKTADDFEVLESEDGRSRISIEVPDHHLDGVGNIHRGTLAGLVEAAGALVVKKDDGDVAQAISLSANFLRLSHARRLIASGVRDALTDTTAHASVSIREDSDEGALIATGQIVFSIQVPGAARTT